MTSVPTEGHRAGLDYLDAVTALLDRIRLADPHAGLFEAAELHWWWAQYPRATDDLDQLFWFDDAGEPVAAVIVTDFRTVTQLDPIVLPDATPEWVAHVVERGLAHAAAAGVESVGLEVDREDAVLRDVLQGHGFAVDDDGLVESWMDPAERPPVTQLHDGYQLLARTETTDRPHHMMNERRDHADPEPRLRQTSLYRPDLDLAIYDADENVAAYGLFWHNPTTGVGVVEPMRTEEAHQQRGLARHLLTEGIDRLVQAGAERIKVCFEPANEASKHLYLTTGFEPHRANDYWMGQVQAKGFDN